MMALRVVEVIGLWIVFATWLWTVERNKKMLTRPLYRGGLIVGVVVCGTMVGAATNLATHSAVTPGAIVLFVVVIIGALAIAWVTVADEVRQLRSFREVVAHLDEAPDCDTPECMAARKHLHRIANGDES